MDRVPNISPITLLVEWNDRERVFAKGGRALLAAASSSLPHLRRGHHLALSAALRGEMGRAIHLNHAAYLYSRDGNAGGEGEEVSPACAHITNNTAVMTEAA